MKNPNRSPWAWRRPESLAHAPLSFLRRRLHRAGLGLGLAAAWVGSVALAAPPQVPVMVLATQAVGATQVLDGRIEAVRQSTLSAQASGRLLQLQVRAGDRVRAGQVLAVIDDRSAQAGVAQAQAGLAQAEAQRANAQAQFERTRDLRAQGFVAQAALDQAQAQWRAAEAAVEAARAGRTQSQLAQGFTRLNAPYDGWVLQTHAEAGDLALPGTPVLTVYAPQPLRAVVHVPASRQALAQQASRVEVELPDAPGRWVAPAARTVVPAADAVSQTVEWRLDLAAADAEALVPGRPVRVRFVGGEAARMVVPASAVLRRGELTAVYRVQDGGAFALRAVRLGAAHALADGGEGFEVLAGLKAGERIALDPVRAGLAGARAAQ